MSQIVTGEAVAIDLRVARVGSRLIGAVIDLLVQFVFFVVLILLLTKIAGSDSALADALSTLAYVLTAVGYPLVLEMLWGGRTLGKFAMGLRAVRDDGSPMRFRQALVRALVRAIVENPLLGVPAIVSSMVSERGKRLGDLLAGTVVLQERIPVSGADAPFMPRALMGWATTLDLSRLTDDLALSARQFLGRANDLSDAAREQLGARLVQAMQQVVTPPPPPGTPGWAYLSAVLSERRRREERRQGIVQGAGWQQQQQPRPQYRYQQPQYQAPQPQPQYQAPQPQPQPQYQAPQQPAPSNPFTLPG